jgi:N-acetylglucosamine-6-phosphate deacetylase
LATVDLMGVHVAAAGMVLTPDGVVPGEVMVDDGVVVDVRRTGKDAPTQWVCPGFVDLQVNGSHGIDVATAPDRLGELGRLLLAEGTTAFLPTVVTGPDVVRDRAILVARAAATSVAGALPLGLHLEGPMISRRRRGAHREEHIAHVAGCPTSNWTPAAGVRLVTLAPELPGALELIAELTAVGVVVALGHTDAGADEFQAGLDAGATYVTHLFNAMRPFSHRDPGPIGVVLADDEVVAGLICDRIHVDPVAVRMAWRSLGPDRLNLVTDAVAARATGTFPDGVRLHDGTLAGSTLTLDGAMRNLVAITGASVPDAVRTITSTPARVLGLTDRGRIAPGCRADLTVLDDDLSVVDTILAMR